MLRLLWYFLVGYVLWKVVQMVIKAIAGPGLPGSPPPAAPPQAPRRKDFTDVRDAEFEDITPKNDPKKPSP